MDNHHYHHQHHWQPLPYPAVNHPGGDPHPNYYQPPPHPHPHPQQQVYFNRPPDHFVEQNNDRHFNNPNPPGYPNPNPNFNNGNSHMTNNEPNDSVGGFYSGGRKRVRYGSDPNGDGLHVKLYVSNVPSTSVEENVRPLFEKHGRVVLVVFPKDKMTGQQQGYCFVKYATLEEAEGAIRALNGQHTFPGEKNPIKVKFAVGERERLGILERDQFAMGGRERFAMGERERFATGEREQFATGEREHVGRGEHVDKLFVGSISKQASQLELEEIFSPYGHVEDVFIATDAQKQNRGYAFIKYSHRDMALAAIEALNGTFTMRGCDLPLNVRFADPKKPRTVGELRGNRAFRGQNFVPCSQEHMMRPAPSFGNGVGGRILPNPPYPVQEVSMYSQPEAAPHAVNMALGAPSIIEQALPLVKQPTGQLCHMPPQEIQAPKNFLQPSQQALHETTKQTQHLDQQRSVQVPLESSLTGSNPLSPETADPQECDWSEHSCPDGYKYYYNCVTYESSWEKPDELTSFHQQLLKQQKVHDPSQLPHLPSIGFCGEDVDQIQKDLDHVKIQSETIPIIDPACV
ncbi:Flowering time control protein FCA [Euphorbia peplus]|nr:Flowering time control protein FCA [Euphorbia peplus]